MQEQLLDIDAFKGALDKAADYHYDMSRSLLRKLEERDKEIIRLRSLLREHGIDPSKPVRQMELSVAQLDGYDMRGQPPPPTPHFVVPPYERDESTW